MTQGERSSGTSTPHLAWHESWGDAACGTCHGVPPAGAPHTPAMTVDDCHGCHPSTIDALGGLIGGPGSVHIDGDNDAHDPFSIAALARAAIAAPLLLWYLVRRSSLTRATKLILLLGIGVFPILTAGSGNIAGYEATKQVQFCGSCHVMTPYARDAQDDTSMTLAARGDLRRLSSLRRRAPGTAGADPLIMAFPIQISFQGVDHSEALVAHIEAAAAKLDEVYDRIERCEVVVEAPHRHSPRTPRFHVRVRLHVPGPDIIIDRDADDDVHDDPYIAARHALQAARRRLETHVAHLRGAIRQRVPSR